MTGEEKRIALGVSMLQTADEVAAVMSANAKRIIKEVTADIPWMGPIGPGKEKS